MFYAAAPFYLIVSLICFSGCSGSAADGAKLFYDNSCIECHSFKGKGGRMGPDLTAVTQRRSTAYIKKYIRNPEKKNPQARMPSFSYLTNTEINSIIKFLEN